MTLIACKECAAQISSTAVACPHCGAKVSKAPKWPWIVGTPITLLCLLLLWGSTIPEYETEARRLRDACEQIVGKANFLGMKECENIYNTKLREGRQLEEVRKRGVPAPPSPTVQLPLTPEQKKRSACADDIESAKADFEARMRRREFKTAAEGMRSCADLLEDPFLQGMVKKADLRAKESKK